MSNRSETVTKDDLESIAVGETQLDPGGPDVTDGTATKLDEEWIELRNQGSVELDVGGWVLSDDEGHEFTFPPESQLGPGDSTRIYTGSGPDGYSMDRDWYVWENNGDIVRLYAQPTPVLVHGLWSSSSIWDELVDRLDDEPVADPVEVGLPDTHDDIRTLAESKLQPAVESAGAPVDLVGHSLGGLVARYYVEEMGGDEYIRSLTCLGSPNHGTPLADVAEVFDWPESIHQMRPGSDLLETLNEGDLPEDVSYTTIAGTESNVIERLGDWLPEWLQLLDDPNDGVVSANSVHLGGATNHTAASSHTELYHDDDALDRVVDVCTESYRVLYEIEFGSAKQIDEPDQT